MIWIKRPNVGKQMKQLNKLRTDLSSKVSSVFKRRWCQVPGCGGIFDLWSRKVSIMLTKTASDFRFHLKDRGPADLDNETIYC